MSARPISIPKDPEARARLYEFAGLTAEERHAVDVWCAIQGRENDARTRRGLERNADSGVGGVETP